MCVVCQITKVNSGQNIDNYINVKAFLRLTEPDIRKMVPPIGLTKRICTLIPKVHNSEIAKLANFWLAYIPPRLADSSVGLIFECDLVSMVI